MLRAVCVRRDSAPGRANAISPCAGAPTRSDVIATVGVATSGQYARRHVQTSVQVTDGRRQGRRECRRVPPVETDGSGALARECDQRPTTRRYDDGTRDEGVGPPEVSLDHAERACARRADLDRKRQAYPEPRLADASGRVADGRAGARTERMLAHVANARVRSAQVAIVARSGRSRVSARDATWDYGVRASSRRAGVRGARIRIIARRGHTDRRRIRGTGSRGAGAALGRVTRATGGAADCAGRSQSVRGAVGRKAGAVLRGVAGTD